MVERKCAHIKKERIEAMQAKTPTSSSHQKPELVTAVLMALHQELMHEHYDFYLATQHSSAGFAIGALATKHLVPARMCFRFFSQLSKHRLPLLDDYELTFVCPVYQIMAVPSMLVPAFEHTWIEGPGHLGWYWMAIEIGNICS